MRTPIAEGEFYHVYNRGVEKRNIFSRPEDYDRFLVLLHLCNSTESVHMSVLKRRKKNIFDLFTVDRGEQIVAIHAYILMPNHFHLLIQAKRGDASIGIFMQKFTTAYTMYFNKLNGRVGGLFQGTYKSIHVDSDQYLQYLFAYLHSNSFPLFKIDKPRSDMNKVLNYRYSSILDYRGVIRPENAIVDRSFFQEYCKNDETIKEYLKLWLTYHNHDGTNVQG